MSMRLSELLKGLVEVDAAQDCVIGSIHTDSRTLVTGGLFIATPGVRGDGRDHIPDAIERGAIAVLVEAGGYTESAVKVPVILMKQLNENLGELANRFFDSPSHRLTVIGVTGTNGKTSCTQLLSRLLDSGETRCAVIGTLGNGFPDALDPASHTTPDVISLHGLLAEFVRNGATHVCIEVSSHALEQNRVDGVRFDVAVFTNLSRDHLDYHGNMENYGLAKARLFRQPGLSTAVINIDDAFGRELADDLVTCKVIRYGLNEGDVQACDVTTRPQGLAMTLVTDEGEIQVETRLYGRFNAYNLLAVSAVLVLEGWTLDRLAGAIAQLLPVVGRMERFSGGRLPVVVVDYAHTPDALEQALASLREHTVGRLWCVFGCGGDRDTGKRPLMGEVAERLADEVVLTDDNPRTEDAMHIIRDIESGMKHKTRVIQPRERAVRETLSLAASDDLVLIAGKGHEDYQEIGRERLHYSDRELVQQLTGEAA